VSCIKNISRRMAILPNFYRFYFYSIVCTVINKSQWLTVLQLGLIFWSDKWNCRCPHFCVMWPFITVICYLNKQTNKMWTGATVIDSHGKMAANPKCPWISARFYSRRWLWLWLHYKTSTAHCIHSHFNHFVHITSLLPAQSMTMVH